MIKIYYPKDKNNFLAKLRTNMGQIKVKFLKKTTLMHGSHTLTQITTQ